GTTKRLVRRRLANQARSRPRTSALAHARPQARNLRLMQIGRVSDARPEKYSNVMRHSKMSSQRAPSPRHTNFVQVHSSPSSIVQLGAGAAALDQPDAVLLLVKIRELSNIRAPIWLLGTRTTVTSNGQTTPERLRQCRTLHDGGRAKQPGAPRQRGKLPERLERTAARQMQGYRG
ncbi:hypothetical protein TOPH_01052, partial [Tolypocladium ophioglossoides CBS 100239]